jgi:DNA-directed RNA polymerase specialized sigma24 family protein
MTDTRHTRAAAERNDQERAQRADRDAFGRLYQRHAPASWRLALVVGRDPAVAERAVVDAFARVLGAPDRHDAPRFAPVATQLLQATRASAVEAARQVDDPIGLARLHPNAHEATARAFDALPERWRSVLWLGAVEGLDLATTAEVLGVPAPTAVALGNRALAGLRGQFATSRLHPAMTTSCYDTTRRLGGYAAQALPERDAARVRRHLDRCEECRARLDEVDDLTPHLRHLAPALPLVIEALAVEAWLARAAEDVGPLGLRLPNGRPVPAWAERALAGATAAVVGFGISAAVLLGGRDDDGDGVPIDTASGFASDGEQALDGGRLGDDRFDSGPATVPAPSAPVSDGPAAPTAVAGSSAVPSPEETPRGGEPTAPPPPAAPIAPIDPGPAPAPTTPPAPVPTDDPTPVEEVIAIVEDVVDDLCTGVGLVDGLTGCEATEATEASDSGSLLGL